jgi:hypothetical protein
VLYSIEQDRADVPMIMIKDRAATGDQNKTVHTPNVDRLAASGRPWGRHDLSLTG